MKWTGSAGFSKLAACGALLVSLNVGASDASRGEPRQRAVLPGAVEVDGSRAELELVAKHLSYRPAGTRPCPAANCAGRLVLSGGVRLVVGELRIAADQAEVLLDPAGELRRVLARGSVRVVSRRGTGQARRVELAVSPALLVELSGDAQLAFETLGLRLRGARIALDLTTGKAVVHDAQAAMRSARGFREGWGR